MVAARGHVVTGLVAERHEKLRQFTVIHKRHTARHDSYHRVWKGAKSNRLADDRSVAPEAALPQPVGEQDHAMFAELFVGRRKVAAEHWPDAEHIEKRGRDLCPPRALRFLARRGQYEAAVIKYADSFKDVIARNPLLNVGHGAAVFVDIMRRAPQGDQALRLGISDRSQQYRINNAENGDVCANADGKRQPGNEREAWRLA